MTSCLHTVKDCKVLLYKQLLSLTFQRVHASAHSWPFSPLPTEYGASLLCSYLRLQELHQGGWFLAVLSLWGV